MINIKINSSMEVATIFGSRKIDLIMPNGALISDLILELESQYGEPMTKVFYGSNRDLKQFMILNGRSLGVLNGIKTELNDGDQVFIMPIVAGG